MAANESTNASPPPAGGTIEPTRGRERAQIAKTTFQMPAAEPGERYELRDPLNELTYRSNDLAQITAQADRLGSTRVTAIAADGRHTTLSKADGEWKRGEPQPARTATKPDLSHERDDESKPTARPTEQKAAEQQKPTPADLNKLEAHAERELRAAMLQQALAERYVIKKALISVGEARVGHAEYRFRGDPNRVAFTESTFRLATDTNQPSVARSMVDVAETRNWKALRVTGNEEFKRQVWVEATVRDVKTVGYEPSQADLDLVKREKQARQINRIEPIQTAQESTATTGTDKASGRGGGRKAVIEAIDAVLKAKGVRDNHREAILNAATKQLAARSPTAPEPKVKLYDKKAPSRRPELTPVPKIDRSRDRAAQTR